MRMAGLLAGAQQSYQRLVAPYVLHYIAGARLVSFLVSKIMPGIFDLGLPATMDFTNTTNTGSLRTQVNPNAHDGVG
jgi:hypothetical protein